SPTGLWGGHAAGTSSRRSRSSASTISSATSKWPKWIGLKEPPNTPTRGTGRLLTQVPVSPDNEFGRRQLSHADRAARMELGGRDPHLGAHAERRAIHQPRGGIDEHRGRVDLLGEPPRATDV